jgi:hypothetical protein
MSEWIEKFVREWNLAESLDEFIERYPMKRRSASAMASNLRGQGHQMKYFDEKKGDAFATRSERDKKVVETALKLKRLGATYEDLAVLMGVSKQAVQQRLKR